MEKKQFISAGFAFLIFILILKPGYSATYYVPDDFATIQQALDGVIGGDTIVVRDDTYKGPGNRNLNFNGKAVILKSENGPDSCIIDCGGLGVGFLFVSSELSNSVLDGFTVKNGNGGVSCINFSSPTIYRCTFIGNSASNGGGISCAHYASPLITGCNIKLNSAINGGGISCCDDSSPIISNCNIVGNTASNNGGGIYCAYESVPYIINCTIAGNEAGSYGGGVCAENLASPVIINCIMWGDLALDGPEIAIGISSWPSSLTVSFGDIKGGQAGVYVDAGCTLNWGTGNIEQNPRLAGGSDLHLLADSPCIDTGTDAGVYTDIDGDTRPQFSGFDMGADEYSELVQINLLSPEKGANLLDPPVFSWTAVGGKNNVFAVDAAFSLHDPVYSTYENLNLVIHESFWKMPHNIWSKIPSGTRVYWRIRGADLNDPPVNIVTSTKVWYFYKQ